MMKSFNYVNFIRHRKYDYLYFFAINRNLFFKNNFLRYFFFIFGLYFIGIFSLLIADVYYADDYHRAVFFQPEFLNRNRYISEYGSKLLVLSNILPDYSPLSQFIAIIFLSFGSIFLVKIITGKLSYISLMSSLPLGLSPHFLSNLAYKYDSPFMSLALTITIIPFLYSARKFVFSLISIITLLIMLTTYQAATGIYPLIALFIAISQIIKSSNHQIFKSSNHQIFNFIFFSAFLYILSLIIYKLFFYPNNTELSLISSPVLLFKHFSQYLSIINKDFHNTTYLKLIILIYFLWATYSVYYSNKSKKIILSLTLIYPFLGIFLSFGLLFFFTPLRFDIRTFVGFGVFIALFSISLVNYVKWKKINTAIIFILSWQLLVIASVFGNSLQAQYEYITLRHRIMYVELSQLLPKDDKYEINIFDNYKSSPVLEASIKYFPAIRRLHYEFVAAGSSYYWNYLGLEEVKNNKCKGNNILEVFDRKKYVIKKFSDNCFEIYYN